MNCERYAKKPEKTEAPPPIDMFSFIPRAILRWLHQSLLHAVEEKISLQNEKQEAEQSLKSLYKMPTSCGGDSTHEVMMSTSLRFIPWKFIRTRPEHQQWREMRVHGICHWLDLLYGISSAML